MLSSLTVGTTPRLYLCLSLDFSLDLASQVSPSEHIPETPTCRLSNHQTSADHPCQFTSQFTVSTTGDYLVNTLVAHSPTRELPDLRHRPALIDVLDPASHRKNEEVKSKLLVKR